METKKCNSYLLLEPNVLDNMLHGYYSSLSFKSIIFLMMIYIFDEKYFFGNGFFLHKVRLRVKARVIVKFRLRVMVRFRVKLRLMAKFTVRVRVRLSMNTCKLTPCKNDCSWKKTPKWKSWQWKTVYNSNLNKRCS